MLAPTPSNSPGSYQQKLFISDKTPCQQKMLKCDHPNAERVAPFWTKPKASLPNSLAWDCRQWSILRKADGKCRKKQSRPSKTHYIMPASISSTRMAVAQGSVCASGSQKKAKNFTAAAPPPHAETFSYRDVSEHSGLGLRLIQQSDGYLPSRFPNSLITLIALLRS
jgi:hypothetical protein